MPNESTGPQPTIREGGPRPGIDATLEICTAVMPGRSPAPASTTRS
jgi:hypothetical protein